MNVAILGYGAIAREHALALKRIQEAQPDWDIRLTGVMGRLPGPTRAFADEFGITVATVDLDELLSDPLLEAVIVCSPTNLHAEQTERALRAGKHVLCEIPLATSLAATDRLIDLVAAFDRQLMVCHTDRYSAPLIAAQAMIAAGEVTPRAMVSRFLLDKRENVSWTGRLRSWTDNLLWHHACQVVDTSLWLLGGEAAAVAARATPPDPQLHIPMDLAIVLRTTHEQLVTVAMSYRTLSPVLDYLVIADETTLVIANDELRDHTRVLVSAGPPTHYDTAALERQDTEFLACILTGREPIASARNIRPAMAALQAAQLDLDRQDERRDWEMKEPLSHRSRRRALPPSPIEMGEGAG